VRLTEVYYECRKTKIDSLFGAIGISSGTALSVKVVVVILLTLVLSGKKNGDKKTGAYRTYGIDEREEVRLTGCRLGGLFAHLACLLKLPCLLS
jgi:hypothetical protein